MQILRIDSSINLTDSVSRELTDAVVERLHRNHPDAEVVVRDLGRDPLPHLGPVTTPAVRLPAEAHDDAMAAAAPAERAVLDEFLASDIVVVGAPMYNFSIPSQLKAWIDRLGVPRVTFRYGENGAEGLAGGRRVIIAAASGGSYEPGGPGEHQESLLKAFFGFIGVDDITVVRAAGIGMGPEARAQAIADAKETVAAM